MNLLYQAMVCLNYVRGATIQYRNIMEELPSRMPANHKTKTTSVKSSDLEEAKVYKLYLKSLSNRMIEVVLCLKFDDTILFQDNKSKPGTKTKKAKSKCATKKEVPIKKTLLIPSVSILTLDEFNEIPKYMKGI